ncbi:RluA family pseudouridine synthase [archaeon]|nr:MAG: RluA family pseudouridine synthase [archaeon]
MHSSVSRVEGGGGPRKQSSKPNRLLMDKMRVICGKYTVPIAFQDKFVAIIDKPWRLASQKGTNVDISVPDIMEQYFRHHKTYPNDINDVVLPLHSGTNRSFVGLVHRLDRCVSGLMIVAKNSRAANKLTEALQTNNIEKSYVALVHGHMNSIGWKKYDHVMRNERGQELPVSLYAESIGQFSNHTTLVKVQLVTGRKHQIRAQLSYLGHPILGDYKYGALFNATSTSKRVESCIALASYKITFTKPLLGFTAGFEVKITGDALKPWERWLGREEVAHLGQLIQQH